MPFLQNKYFNFLLPFIFLSLLVILYIYGSALGITDINTLIANAVLLLVSTLIAVSLPLYAAYINYREQKANDTKMVIVAVSRYIGNEILDNLVEIKDIMKNTKDSYEQFKSQASLSKKSEKMSQVGMWLAASEDLVVSLEDKQHQSIVQSGLVAKIENDKLGDGIRVTYQNMDNIIKRLRRFAIFCRMLLNPPEGTTAQFFEFQLGQFDKGMEAIEKDIEIFNDEADKTVKEINVLLKPYGKEIKIVEHEENRA